MSPLPQAAAAAAENRPFRQGGGRHVVMVQHLGWGSAPQRRKQLEHANAHWKSDRAQQPMTLMADGRDLVFSNRPDWLTIPCRDQHPTSRTCPSGSCIRPLPSRTRACPPMMIGRVRQNAASSATWPVRIWNLHDCGGKQGASRATRIYNKNRSRHAGSAEGGSGADFEGTGARISKVWFEATGTLRSPAIISIPTA